MTITSCAISLSPVEITTSRSAKCCFSLGCQSHHPLQHLQHTKGKPMACTHSYSGSICRRRSSGIGGRWALYSAYICIAKCRTFGVKYHHHHTVGTVLASGAACSTPPHRTRGCASGGHQRWQRMKCSVQIRGTVNQNKRSLRHTGNQP